MTRLLDAVLGALEEGGPRPAIVEISAGGARTHTGASLRSAVAVGARALAQAGVRPGEVVSIHVPTAAAALSAALAVNVVGAVACALAPDAPEAPCAVWAWRGAEAPIATGRTAHGLVPEGVVWLRPTGGTTGVPRLAGFTEAQALAFAERSRQGHDLAPGERFVTTAYPWTAYGWNTGLVAPLLGGITVVVVPPVSPRALLEAIRTHGARLAATTPPVVRALARLPASTTPAAVAPAGPRVRLFAAGAAYPAEDAAAVRALHRIDVIDRYGSTEAGTVAQAREPGGPLWPLWGAVLRAVGDPAVLEIRGDAIAWGYVGQPGAAPLPFDGVVRTSDRVEFAPDGSFRLHGRADRAVKRAGRMVDLAGVERALAALPGVALARVRARPGPLDVELEGDVVALDGVSLDGKALLRELAARRPSWECPTSIAVHAHAPEGAWTKWTAANPA